jgi:hypothetical protein
VTGTIAVHENLVIPAPVPPPTPAPTPITPEAKAEGKSEAGEQSPLPRGPNLFVGTGTESSVRYRTVSVDSQTNGSGLSDGSFRFVHHHIDSILAPIHRQTAEADSPDEPHWGELVLPMYEHLQRELVVVETTSTPLMEQFGTGYQSLATQAVTNHSLVIYPWSTGVTGATAALSAVYIAWSLRAGTLLATMLSAVPAWQTFDPLPVLDFYERRQANGRLDRDDDEQAVKQLMDRANEGQT